MHFDFSKTEQLAYRVSTLEYRLNQQQLQSHDLVIAKTHSGRIRGAKRRTIYNRTYYSFEHIPYAQPPLGELRFRAPKPISPWSNVRDCTLSANKPMQCRSIDTATIEGAEDCLYLNVYTNSVRPVKPRPVMVWIYGGGFVCGEATRDWYAPDYFMQQDIVLVTVQYRVGALGFLSLHQPHLQVPGNAGLKDQILALKWIRRNCPRFGGDPQCITVFGQNSGASSVLLLMLSRQAQGLFQRAIAQSPVASQRGEWALSSAAQRAFELAQAAGYEGENNEREMLAYLLTCTGAQIMEAEGKCVTIKDRLLNQFGLFGPCVEPYYTQNTVLHKAPREMLKSAWGNSIPLIVGGNSNEGLFLKPWAHQHPDIVHSLLATCMSFVPLDTVADAHSLECRAKGLQLRKLHVKSDTNTIDDFCELATYAHYWHPLMQLLRARQQYARKAYTYLYRFDYASSTLRHPFGRAHHAYQVAAPLNATSSGFRGAAHGDELAFLFGSVLATRMEPQSVEYRIIKRLIALWTTFAATGSPNGGKINGAKDTKWHPMKNTTNTHTSTPRWSCLNIGKECKFIELPEWAKLRDWESLYDMQRPLPISASEYVDLPLYAQSSL